MIFVVVMVFKIVIALWLVEVFSGLFERALSPRPVKPRPILRPDPNTKFRIGSHLSPGKHIK